MTDSPLGSMSTPDLVLSLIPGPLIVAYLVAMLSTITLPVALAAGSLPAAGLVGYALFWEPPVEKQN